MTIDRCRVCDHTGLECAIDLGDQPWCNQFLKPEEAGSEPFYPLRVVHCRACRTAQLDFTVPKEIMFGDHTYLSGVTRSLSEHFGRVAQFVDRSFFAEKRSKCVLDIGSNDGTQLRHYQDLGYDVLGVESSKTTARIAVENGIPTINRFFNLPALREIGRRFDVINASGVFFHLEELHSVTEAIKEGLHPDGVLVVQFLYMKCIQENGAFDQIYHEHLLYYNLLTIQTLLRRHGLELFDACLAPIHGGSIIGFASHRGSRLPSQRYLQLLAQEEESGCNELSAYHTLSKRIEAMRDRDLRYLESMRQRGCRVYGMGAPAKGNTLLNTFGISQSLLPLLVEKNALRDGLVSPGMHIPVVLEKDVEDPPDAYYVLAWNFRKEILKNHREDVEAGVDFVFPITPKEIASCGL